MWNKMPRVNLPASGHFGAFESCIHICKVHQIEYFYDFVNDIHSIRLTCMHYNNTVYIRRSLLAHIALAT